MVGTDQDQRTQKDTLWRQGHLLPINGHALLDLSTDHRFIVISHDCDIASDEEQVEIISGQFVETADGSLRFGEHPRKLHLPGQQKDSEVFLALHQAGKRFICKQTLNELAPADDWVIPEASKSLLRHWLACRYQRHALPNALNNRLTKALDKLRDAAKSRHQSVLGVFIGFDPGTELGNDEPYELEFAVIYRSHCVEGLQKANEVVSKLRTALEKVEGIEFDKAKVRPYADTEFTLYDMTRLVQFRLEFLSFRGATPGDMITTT